MTIPDSRIPIVRRTFVPRFRSLNIARVRELWVCWTMPWHSRRSERRGVFVLDGNAQNPCQQLPLVAEQLLSFQHAPRIVT